MVFGMSFSARFAALSLSFASTLCFTGCSASFTMPESLTAPAGEIHGQIFGGQQPVVGSHVYVYALGQSGQYSHATSLMTSVSGKTTADGAGQYYVTSDGNGLFSVSGDYTCTAGQQVYLLATGGNAGAGNNTALTMMAGLGQCPSNGGNLASIAPTVNINEVTTVAMAYAFAGAAADTVHIGTANTTDALTAAANSMSTANALVDIAYGRARTVTPSGTGSVPAATINAIANILAACVNASDSAPAACSTLFSNLTNTGGGHPTTTADAAIALAQNVNSSNTSRNSTLFALSTATPPFSPALSSAPSDYSLRIDYATATALATQGNAAQQSTPTSPDSLVIDKLGGVWMAGKHLYRMDPVGNITAYIGSTFAHPAQMVIEPSTGVLWLGDVPAITDTTNYTHNTLYTFNTTGIVGSAYAAGYTGVCGTSGCAHLTVDPSGYTWAGDQNNATLRRIDILGHLTQYTEPRGVIARQIESDSSGAILVSNGTSLNKSTISGSTATNGWAGVFQSSDPILSFVMAPGDIMDCFGGGSRYWSVPSDPAGSVNYTLNTGLSAGDYSAIDSGGNIFTTGKTGSTLEFYDPTGSYTTHVASNGTGMGSLAIDAGGNVWVLENGGNSLAEYVGLASPVKVPYTPGSGVVLP